MNTRKYVIECKVRTGKVGLEHLIREGREQVGRTTNHQNDSKVGRKWFRSRLPNWLDCEHYGNRGQVRRGYWRGCFLEQDRKEVAGHIELSRPRGRKPALAVDTVVRL